MKKYYRVMLGSKSIHASECLQGNYIGAGYGIGQDLTDLLGKQWREFNQSLRPVFLKNRP
jgi:restriction system protein